MIRHGQIRLAVAIEVPDNYRDRCGSHGIAHRRMEADRGVRRIAAQEQKQQSDGKQPLLSVHNESPRELRPASFAMAHTHFVWAGHLGGPEVFRSEPSPWKWPFVSLTGSWFEQLLRFADCAYQNSIQRFPANCHIVTSWSPSEPG